MSVPRPRRAIVPISASVLTLVGWEAIAHQSGVGWVQAIGTMVGSALLVGLVAPAFAVRRVTISCVACPTDADAGSPVACTVHATTRARARAIWPPGPEVAVGSEAVALTLVPPTRGVLRSVLVEIASAAPFGILWWTRRFELLLPRELSVAPRLATPEAVIPLEGGSASGGSPQRSLGGELHTVLPYQPGDARRSVHWPATAHSGALMVSDREDPKLAPVALAVELPDDEEAAERAAEHAFGTLVAIVDTGREVILSTREDNGPRTGRVSTRITAGRRLARSVPGAP